MAPPKNRIAIIYTADARPSAADLDATTKLQAQGYTVRHRNITFVGAGESPEDCAVICMSPEAIKIAPAGFEALAAKKGITFQPMDTLPSPSALSADKLNREQLLARLAELKVEVPAGLEISDLRTLLERSEQKLL